MAVGTISVVFYSICVTFEMLCFLEVVQNSSLSMEARIRYSVAQTE